MAEQTKTQRQAAGHKAAATRKRNAAKRSATATKTAARRTNASASATVRTSARQTGRNARQTTKQASRTAGHRFDAATQRVEEFGRRAQRAFYIQVGAAAEFRDTVARQARKFASLSNATVELDKLERRGARALNGTERALNRRRRTVSRDVQRTQRTVERQTNGLRAAPGDLVERVKQLV